MAFGSSVELSPWLRKFLAEADSETEQLRENGADSIARARDALLRRLVEAAEDWLDRELSVPEAAAFAGRCEETIRRSIRDGTLPDRRINGKGKHRIKYKDLHDLKGAQPYDPITDAQIIAQLRRSA